MELRELRTFCAVVDTGSFSEAAEVVYLTQPSVSIQIQSLEQDLGICLFNRSKRERCLTEEGKRLYEYAKKVIALCDEAVQSISDVGHMAKADIHLGASTTVGEYVLPSHLASFKEIYPCAQISLKISHSLEIIDEVIKGSLEMGIVGAKIKRNGLIYKDFIRDELVLIVSSKHRWASQEKIALEQIKEEPFLVRVEGSGTMMAIKKGLEKVGVKEEDLNIIMSLGNIEAIKNGVSSGIGISIVPKMAIKNELKLDLVKEVKIEGISLEMNFYIVYNPSRFRSKLPEIFLEHLLE